MGTIKWFNIFPSHVSSLKSQVYLCTNAKTHPHSRLAWTLYWNRDCVCRSIARLGNTGRFPLHASGIFIVKHLCFVQHTLPDRNKMDQSGLCGNAFEFNAVNHVALFPTVKVSTTSKAKISDYFSLIVFSHTIFAMPFAIIGYFLALKINLPGQEKNMLPQFSFTLFGLVILCMIFARSAAMGFNRYIDRSFDAKNKRTAVREIPAGKISPRSALLFVIGSSFLFMTCTFFINSICFYLSPVALLVVLGYSYTKRFTALCHLILGIGLSLAPIGAWLAVRGEFAWLPLFFSFAVIFWVSGFDMIYALQDEQFDRENKLYSIPSWLGINGALRVSEIFHLISASFIFYAGWYAHFGIFYWIGFGIYCSLLIYQHSIVKPNDLSKVNRAFGTTNGIASVIFAAFVLLELFVRI